MKKIEPVTVKWFANPNYLHEIYSSGAAFSLVSDNNEQCHQPVYCKDFLQDAISSQVTAKKVSIYGFKFDPKINPKISQKKLRILFSNDLDKEFVQKSQQCLNFLHQIEKRLGFQKTKMIDVANAAAEDLVGRTTIFEADKNWMLCPQMVSLYTLLMRVGMAHKVNNDFQQTVFGVKSGKIPPYQKNDKTYMAGGLVAFQTIVAFGPKFIFGGTIKSNFDNKKTDIHTWHNHTGITSWLGESHKSNFKDRWLRDEILPLLPTVPLVNEDDDDDDE